MKLDQLSYFLEASKQQHIGKASRILSISPSAISHSIAALEEELGRPLFEKIGRQIQLTSYGKILAERAEFLLSEAERMREEIMSDQAELRGHYKLGGTHMLASDFLTHSWVRLHADHPQISADMYSLPSAEVVRRVALGELDFGICFSPQYHPAIQSEILFTGQLTTAVRKSHPILKSCNPKDLSKYPAAMPKAYQGIENCVTHPIFEKYGINPKVALVYDSYQSALQALVESDMWTLIPEILIASNKKIQKFECRGWNAPYTLCGIWPTNRVKTNVLNSLIADLRKNLNSN